MCVHTNTQIWEPHLAGARKCKDCGMVYNPNHTPQWFFEEEIFRAVGFATEDIKQGDFLEYNSEGKIRKVAPEKQKKLDQRAALDDLINGLAAIAIGSHPNESPQQKANSVLNGWRKKHLLFSDLDL